MLTKVIDISYQVFAKYNPTRPLDICTDCCMNPADEVRLAGLPVRDIPRDLLAEYNDGAKPEKTRIDEVKHFLPRYFDLIGQFEFPSHSTELSLSRLVPFDKSEWANEELEVLNRFSLEYFRHCLSVYPLPGLNDRLDAILIMLWKAGFDIDALLTIWENDKTRASALHFRDLHFYGFDKFNQTKLANAFGDKELANILQTWMNREAVKQSFADMIENLIMERNDLADADINDLNMLYDIVWSKKDCR